jgi:putative glutamine amidotransferase
VCDAALSPITGDTEIVYSDKATAVAIVKAGGLPMYLPAISAVSDSDLQLYLDAADAILVTGADTNMNPIYYGETPLRQKKETRIDDERDRIDLQLVRKAYEKTMPMIGICKGMQVINVALGGTLYQDVTMQHESSFSHDISKTNRANLTHLATMAEDSSLQDIFGMGEVHLNGGHQQAVKVLSDKLKPGAIAEDGIVEIYEGKDYPFLVGTQFHPELRSFDTMFFKLFERFIAAAARFRELARS